MGVPFDKSFLEQISKTLCANPESIRAVGEAVQGLIQVFIDLHQTPFVYPLPNSPQGETELIAFPHHEQLMAGSVCWALSQGVLVAPSAGNDYLGIVMAKPAKNIRGEGAEVAAIPIYIRGKAGQVYALDAGSVFPYVMDCNGQMVVGGDLALDVVAGTPGAGNDATYEHNEVDVGQQPQLDFKDTATVVWTVTNDGGNQRVKVEATATPAVADAIYSEDGTLVGQRPELNFNNPTGAYGEPNDIRFTLTDNNGEDRVDVTAAIGGPAKFVLFSRAGGLTGAEDSCALEDFWMGDDPGDPITVLDAAEALGTANHAESAVGVAVYDEDEELYMGLLLQQGPVLARGLLQSALTGTDEEVPVLIQAVFGVPPSVLTGLVGQTKNARNVLLWEADDDSSCIIGWNYSDGRWELLITQCPAA